MSLSDYLKCPGFDRTLSTIPKDLRCPQCGTNVEIWSDEVKRRCHECQTMVFNPDPLVPMPGSAAENQSQGAVPDSIDQARLDELVELAISLGCDGAVIVPTVEIVVDPKLAALCFEPGARITVVPRHVRLMWRGLNGSVTTSGKCPMHFF
jgi:hypothetical protein